jgi:hypothetical protein
MFKAYDVENHAGLLRGMNRRSLGGPDSAPPSLLSSQQALQAYLAQPFKVPAKDSPEAALFAQAVLFAQSDATVKSYFTKLQAALKHKVASLKQKGLAETDQAALDKLPNRITVAQDAVDKSKKYYIEAINRADDAFANFYDWIEQSTKLIARGVAGWGYWTPGFKDAPIIGKVDQPKLWSDAERIQNGDIINKVLMGKLPEMSTKFRSWQEPEVLWRKVFDNGYAYSTGPEMQYIPNDSVVFNALGENTPGIVIVDNLPRWRSNRLALTYAPTPKMQARLRYVGDYANQEPAVQGFFATNRWNNNFLPALAGATKLYQQFVSNTKILQDLQASLNALTQAVADENAAAQTEQAAYEKGLADANAIKSKLSGFLLGYADTLGEQYTKAAELNGLTAAREAMQEQNAKWFADYDAMTKQGAALVVQAESETDLGRKAALRIEGARRLGRALELNARGQSLRDGALKRYGERRSAASKNLADLQDKSKLTLPPQAQKQAQVDTAKIAELDAKIADIQAKADETKKEIIDGLNKLPDEFKPPNAPKVKEKPQGGAGWILALGAAGAAFIAYKRGH